MTPPGAGRDGWPRPAGPRQDPPPRAGADQDGTRPGHAGPPGPRQPQPQGQPPHGQPARGRPQDGDGADGRGAGGPGGAPPEGDTEAAQARGDDARRQRWDSASQEAGDLVRERESAEDAALFGLGLNAARLNFTVSGGNVIFGGRQDAVTGTVGAGSGTAGRRVPGLISDRELARVVRSFVAPAVYPTLRTALRQRHLVVLRASRGWGRTAVAEYLLHDVLTADAPGVPDDSASAGVAPRGAASPRVRISRLGAETGLRELGTAELTDPPGSGAGPAGGPGVPGSRGFLFDVGTPPNADVLRGSDLERLAHELAAGGVYLVVTVDADTVFGDELEDFLHDGGPPVDALRLLAAHAARHLRIDHAQAWAAVRADPDLEPMVEALLREGFCADAVAQLGERWARGAGSAWARGEPADPRARDDLRQWLKEYLDDRFVAWMTGTDDPTHRAFVIALAVFNGMPYSKVTRLGRDLEARLLYAARFPDPPEGHPADRTTDPGSPNSDGDVRGARRDRYRYRGTTAAGAGPSLFSGPRGPRLAAARAMIQVGTDDTPYGDITVELVRLRDDGYAWKILNWLWHEQDGVHTVLVEWLSALGGDRDVLVRVRAAAAVGLLASWGFDEMRLRVLLPWADEDRPWQRAAAGAALSIAVHHDPSLRPVTTRMLRDWRVHTFHPQRRKAAVRAWGASLGPADLPDALSQILWLIEPIEGERDDTDDADDLDRIDLPLLGQAAQSVLELFEGSAPGAADAVVNALGGWTRAENPLNTRLAGYLSFLRVAFHATVPEGPGPDGRPALLAVAMPERPVGPRMLRRIAVLWGRILNEPLVNALGLECLHGWTASAEADEEIARTTLAHVVWESLSTQVDFRRMWSEFSRWERQSPRTSRAVLATIEHSVQGDDHGLR
ncbi:hypothetical protein [Parafrankia discariae]|uniref:hypothetical protein n=1 Tax=Parafrankia discariae TaxID=365528 RepID=UPI000379A26C|nr:hypothetical protein [Parafrankia discariae]